MSTSNFLKIAFKLLSDTAGPNGLIPSLLLFCVMPRIQITAVYIYRLNKRVMAMDNTFKELSKTIASSRVSKAIQSNTPPNTLKRYSISDHLLVYREATKSKKGP